MKYLLALLLIILPFNAFAALNDSNLQAFWGFQNNYTDSTPNAIAFTNNGATLDAGLIGNAVDFGASNSSNYVNSSNLLNLGVSTPFTFNMWIKVTNQPANNTPAFVFSWANVTGGSNNEWSNQLQLYNNGGTMQVYISRNRPTPGQDQTGTNYTFTPGTWYMLTFTWNGTNQYLYVNGSATPLITNPSSAAPSGTYACSGAICDNGVTLGQDTYNANRFFSGKIDALSVYSRVLSSAEIAQLYLNGIGIEYPFTFYNPSQPF